VRCPPDEAIQIRLFNSKVDVDPVEGVASNSLRDILGHLHIVSTVLLRKKLFLVADLNPGRVKRRIHILVTRDKNNVLEPLEASLLGELVEVARLDGTRLIIVSHLELLKTLRLLPSLEEPNAGVDQRRSVEHVAHVGRRERHEIEQFTSVLLQVWECGPRNAATERMCYDAYLGETVARAVVLNMVVDLRGEVSTHHFDTTLSLVLIRR
jgi:hypothetical protein